MNKRIHLMTVACIAAGLAVAADAEAGLLKRSANKGAKRTEKTAEQKRPRHIERTPEMTFVRGRLNLESPGVWRVDGLRLVIREDCVMMKDGLEFTVLEEGREVMVTGAACDVGMEAWGIEVVSLADVVPVPNPERQVAVSDSDPSCGEVIFSPY